MTHTDNKMTFFSIVSLSILDRLSVGKIFCLFFSPWVFYVRKSSQTTSIIIYFNSPHYPTRWPPKIFHMQLELNLYFDTMADVTRYSFETYF